MARTPLACACHRDLARDFDRAGCLPMGHDPLVHAPRHRRQYAHVASARAVERAGLVRPAPIQAQSARRFRHALEPPRRPADRGDHTCRASVRRWIDRRAYRRRNRADAASLDRACRGRARGAAAGRAGGGAACGRRRRAVLSGGAVHVRADAYRPSRLAARIPHPRHCRCRRPAGAARRDRARPGERGVARHRARTAAVPDDHGCGDGAALGMAARGSRPPVGLRTVARGRLCRWLSRVRVVCQCRAALRRAVAGLAWRNGRGGMGRVAAAACAARHMAAPPRRGRCRRYHSRGGVCAARAAMPRAARTSVARALR